MEDDIKLVVFDLDGTLIHLPIQYDRLKHEISKILRVNKVDSILSAISKAGLDERNKIFKIWDSLEAEAFLGMKKIEEGIRIYNDFHDKLKCLVTLQGRRVVRKILEETGLTFNHIITREDSVNRDEQLRIAIEKFKINPKEILVVGDRESDKEAAEKLGCRFIFIRSGMK
ncbi:MAG: HAD-IA family hydrolase [Candidatus Bathyarchaeota archaeon]|nr:HAD-IA family hydrolase [Candidatus Bathyarchaeota archaeon]